MGAIVTVGSLAFDSIQTPAGKVDQALGGSANYFSISASNFAPTKVVGVVGQDFPKDHIEYLKSRGIDTSGVQWAEGKTFHWQGEYKDDMNQAITHNTELNVFEHFDPKLPESYLGAEYLFLGNIDPELQIHVLEQIRSPKIIALDSMNFWITGAREKLLQALPKIDILIINDGEARLLGDDKNLIAAIEKIAQMGPKALVIKQGEYGSFIMMEGNFFATPALPLRKLVDPTGAGDTFAGGVIGYMAKNNAGLDFPTMKKALLYGTVMSSYTVQDFSINRLKEVTENDIATRYDELMKMITVE